MGISANAQDSWTLRQCIDYATTHNVTILQAEITVKKSLSNIYARLGVSNRTSLLNKIK